MKFRLKRNFSVQINPRKVHTYPKGEYDVPSEMKKDHAEKAQKQHLGFFIVEKIVEKKAPENKVVEITESKSKVGRKAKRSSRPRPKSD